jgi:GH43 family beta-xylosidase
MIRRRSIALLVCLSGAGCPGSSAAPDVVLGDRSRAEGSAADAARGDGPLRDGAWPPDGKRSDGGSMIDAAKKPDAAKPCTTRVSYGSGWIKPASHPASYDDASGLVTWDGSCKVDASGNAYATLSNGWKPYFSGRSCVIALDASGACPSAPGACATRVSYGPAWIPGPNHPAYHDDVQGVLTWDGVCHASGSQSYAVLSNGWTPTFSGSAGCDLAFRHTQCGGLYANPVVGSDCPDPGVLEEGGTFYMVCTPGWAFPLRSSKDLVSWTSKGSVFASAPAWAASHFWAPELHKVGSTFVVYYSAKSSATGTFAIGAGKAASVLGPYTDLGKPLLTAPAPGVIDAHYFRAASGKHYLLFKVDGNAVGQPTPIRIQELAADGLSLVGSPTTILSNTLAWEGALVEGPWLIERGGYFYLFYSGNGYASPSYGVGVARASSPLGPYTKAGAPILVSKGGWAGPGHGSVLVGPSGDWVHVYHAWVAGKVGQSPGRLALVDRLQWENGWPLMRGAPTSRSQPLP